MSVVNGFEFVSYTQCQCGLPGCCIRVAQETDGTVWVAMASRPGSLWMRLKAAWRHIRGYDIEWFEIVLSREQCCDVYTQIMHDSKPKV
jgi:hypothetical protein